MDEEITYLLRALFIVLSWWKKGEIFRTFIIQGIAPIFSYTFTFNTKRFSSLSRTFPATYVCMLVKDVL